MFYGHKASAAARFVRAPKTEPRTPRLELNVFSGLPRLLLFVDGSA